jgi:flagellar biosynthesis protein FlhF
VKIKEFEALSLKECLGQVRSELGPEAVILETRKSKKGGILGWGARDSVRILAGTGIAIQGEGGRATESGRAAGRGSAESHANGHAGVTTHRDSERAAAEAINPASRRELRRDAPDIATFLARHAEAAAAADAVTVPGRDADTSSGAKIATLEGEVREIKSALATLARSREEPARKPEDRRSNPDLGSFDKHPELRRQLLDADVNAEVADSILSGVLDLEGLAPELQKVMAAHAARDAMAAMIRVSGGIELATGAPKVVALVGPTGVGKTTTIAKLAAHHALVLKQRVGLITMDTYRIAAVEQLRAYSQIIGIPLEVAHAQSDVIPALQRLSECDMVLVDTAGRSQRNAMQVNELKSLVAATGCEAHLVLPASTRERDILDQIERFASVGIDRLLFTKLDETTSYGTLFNVAASTSLPLSYFSTGQKVPEDLEAVTAEGLIARILIEH